MDGMMLLLWGSCLATALLPAQAQEVFYIHTDAQGSTVAETDANRNVVARFEYEPFGQRIGPGSDDKPGYTGHVMDAVTGLVQMQQRYYDPGIGVFLSVDPVTVREKPITNFCRYCYARNNSYRFTDPDGRQAKPDKPLVKYQTIGRRATESGAVKVERQTVSDYGIAHDGRQMEDRGSVTLLPQASADGDPAKVGDAVMTRLLNFSDKEGKTVEVTSGQRTVEQNRAVRGASRSQHLQNNAADIRISGNTTAKTADAAHASGEFNRVNEYSNGQGVHVDLKQSGNQGRFYDWRPQE
jgi:RHS repeat-associated protein